MFGAEAICISVNTSTSRELFLAESPLGSFSWQNHLWEASPGRILIQLIIVWRNGFYTRKVVSSLKI